MRTEIDHLLTVDEALRAVHAGRPRSPRSCPLAKAFGRARPRTSRPTSTSAVDKAASVDGARALGRRSERRGMPTRDR